MKKLLILLFSIFFLSSTSVFSETYVCSQDLERYGRKGEIETIVLERDGNRFKDGSGGYQISHESDSTLILTEIYYSEPSFYILFIDKDTKEWGSSYHAMDEYRKDSPRPFSYGKCVIVQ